MDRTRFRRRLLQWFDRHQRDLPWRTTRDPYRIWVSEVMLQQTTVAAVVSYFNRFIKTFPTLAHLAAADEQSVLKLWEGLGYYRRARHLHQAAKTLMDAGGTLPDDPEVWRELPGVGRYILGAVLSQAFDRKMPIVEANTIRVLCRLFAERGDPKSTTVQKWLWQTAEELLPKSRVGDFNQAMMELGALICTPIAPKCIACPARSDCAAFAAGLQDEIPWKGEKRKPTQVQEVALVIRRRDSVLLVQRRDDAARWAGMWEFPRAELQAGESYESAARRLLQEIGLKGRLGEELMTIPYTVTRFRMSLVALECTASAGKIKLRHYAQGAWLVPKQLADYPVATAQRRLAEEIARAARQRRLF